VLAADVAGSFAQRFQREVETLAQLSHVNVVMAFDAGESDAGPYLAMEFVDGRDLASDVRHGGPLGLAEAVDCILQAARGLAYAHGRGLIHRDIKPANLLRDPAGVVKVADLGVARITGPRPLESEGALTQAGGILGTVDYMAPEQAVDSTAVDHRADIYSLGCTLFFLLTGRPMYSGTSLMGLLLKHREEPAPSLLDELPGAPEIVNTIFQRMVAKKREDRYASMTETAQALEEAAALIRSLGLPAPPRVPVKDRTASSEATLEFPSAQKLTDHASERGTHTAPAEIVRGPVPPATVPAPSQSSLTQAHSPATPLQGAPPVGPGPVASAGPPTSRRRILRAAGGVAGVLLVAGLIWRQATRDGGSVGPDVKGPGPVAPVEPPAKAGRFAGVILSGGGSTFINPLMERWAVVYEKRQGVRVDYQSLGSGRGLESVTQRVFQFGCSDFPLGDKERSKAQEVGGELIQIPLVLGAVVPAYNLPGVSGQLRFTGPILADIYLGKIVSWNDPALRVVNPGAELPNMRITPVHRADPSGTTGTWTEFLGQMSGEWKTQIGSAPLVKFPTGLEGKGNNGVANLVSRNLGSLGYVELTYALESNLRFGQVKNQDGKFITPSLESVTAAAGALTDVPADLSLALTDRPGEETYPIVSTTYAILYVDQTGNPAGRDLVTFLRWATHEGQSYAKEVNYAPLPPELVQRTDAALTRVRVKAP
jgi:phosphate ABC transporter phosphate-binding protein